MNFEILKKEARSFFIELEIQMNKQNIRLLPHWSIDHVCYRTQTLDSYDYLKEKFSEYGILLIESMVNGRNICTFKLFQPLTFLNRKIDLIELPAPKKEKQTKEGFEHIEVVCDEDFNSILNRYPSAEFNKKSIVKDLNAELEMSLGELAIKFHHYSLESVINLEKNIKIQKVLADTQLLKKFKKYMPLIVGTFPLGLDQIDSDLDIIMYHSEISELLGELKKSYGHFRDFQSEFINNNVIEYGLVNFIYEDLPIEIYIESTLSCQQRAFKHFQIEEKLLKLGGANFKNKINEFRSQGLKTEPAFTKALNLTGDPYLTLLNLHAQPESLLNLPK